jgi:hypothetical protein
MPRCSERKGVADSVPGGQVESHFRHKLIHSRAPVVSRHVVVQVFPDPLDTIMVRAVRW